MGTPLFWCFRDNARAFGQWAAKRASFEASQSQRIKSIDRACQTVNLPEQTIKRLHLLKQGEQQFLDCVLNALDQIKIPSANPELRQALEARIPGTQHFESYQKNILRDWAWGETENRIYLDRLRPFLNGASTILILGGGSGRLTFDIANQNPSARVVQLDINPLLSFVGQTLCEGQTIDWIELGQNPMQQGQIWKKQTLKVNGPLKRSPQFLLGDASDLPFKDDSFDLIICPWLIDILPEPFGSFCRRLNLALKKNGQLITFGPLSFHRSRRIDQHTTEEIHEIAMQTGFADVCIDIFPVDYLTSPLDAQSRQEKIHWLTAKKVSPAKKTKPYSYFPEWLRDPKSKPKGGLDQHLMLSQQLQLEAQLVQGLYQGISISDMATRSGADPVQAENLILSTLARMIESGQLPNE